MKLIKSVILSLMILASACKENESHDKTNFDKKDNKDSISYFCKCIFSGLKDLLRAGLYSQSYSVVLESESKNFDFKNINAFLKAQKGLFPLNFKHLSISQAEVGIYEANSLLYIDFQNQDEFFIYHFEFINPPKIYYCDHEWSDNLLTSKQKNEIINKCLEVSNYCINIVKIPWKPYLEHLKSIEAVDRYNYEMGIYDSLQKVWNKQDLINKLPKRN